MLQINSSYFSKMTLIGFQYEPISLDVNETCFEEEQNPNTHENQEKLKAFVNGADVGNQAQCTQMLVT